MSEPNYNDPNNPDGAQQPQQVQQNAEPPMQPPPQGRKPDYVAYNVQDSPSGKAFWSRVGAAWEHKDGKGFELSLDSVPVNGKVSLRAQRDERMQNYEQQQVSIDQQPQEVTQHRGPNR